MEKDEFEIREVFEDFKNMISQSVELSFSEQGSISPMLFVGMRSVRHKGKIEAMVTPAAPFLSDANGKDMLSDLLKQIAAEDNPIFIAMVTECWMVKGDKDSDIDEMRKMLPSENPNRKEAVLATFEGLDFQRQIMWEINREEGEEPTLGKMKCEESSSMQGRFAHFFNTAKNSNPPSFNDEDSPFKFS